MAAREETKENSSMRAHRSIMCENYHCAVRFLGEWYFEDPKGDAKGWKCLFVCECVGSLDAEDIEYLRSSDTDAIAATWSCDVATSDDNVPDSLDNIRVMNCSGKGCGIRFGIGIHIHCESCYRHVLFFLR